MTNPAEDAVIPKNQPFEVAADAQFSPEIGTCRGYWQMKSVGSSLFTDCTPTTMIAALTENPFPVMQSDLSFSGELQATVTGSYQLRMRVINDDTQEVIVDSPAISIRVLSEIAEG